MQVFVLIGIPHNPDLTFGGPGKQLGQIVDDYGNLEFKLKAMDRNAERNYTY